MHFFKSHDNIYESLVNSTKQTLKNIEAWLSLVERCVRDAEVASSNLVATTKNTPSHMCEGVFLFLQLFKLTTSNWFGHTVRAQRAHEVRGTSACADRSGAETSNFRALAGLEKKNDTDLVSFFFQARDGDRTRDPLLGKEVLHH